MRQRFEGLRKQEHAEIVMERVDFAISQIQVQYSFIHSKFLTDILDKDFVDFVGLTSNSS
jgi:hypothetical protein